LKSEKARICFDIVVSSFALGFALGGNKKSREQLQELLPAVEFLRFVVCRCCASSAGDLRRCGFKACQIGANPL
jgi:hypothetical protein